MTQHLFRCQDAALIRIAANPDSSAPAPPEPAGDTAVPVDEWRQWLRQAWDDETAEAIELASPSLAAAVRQACAEELQPGRLAAVSMSVLRYLLRMTSRATPFGTFAGIAPVRLDSRAAVLQAGSRRTSSRPDPVWLADVITALQAHPGVFRQLTVTANNLCFERAGRMIIACRPGTGGAPPSEISIRSTTAVRQVMHAAQESPVAVGDLADMIAARHSDTPPQTIERMLGELVTCGALLTNLCAPVTVTDPLGHLIDQLGQLTAAGPGRDTLTSLRTIRHLLACHDQASGPGERRRLRKQATCSMRELSARADQPITTDLLLGTQVRLPPGVLREAEAAASALARLSPYRSGRPSWQEYHARFLDCYGEGAIIPVAQLVNPATGLGYPAGYRGSAAPHPVRPVTSRDRALMRMAQQAAMEDRLEIELDDATMGELAAETAMRTVPHTELRFSLHARTTAALDRGEFTLVVGGASRNGGTTVGRFLHLLDQPDRDRVVQTLNDMAPALPGAALAQLSSPPLCQDATDLARTPPVFPVLSLGEHQPPRPGQIPLTDLAVSGDAKRLFLVRLSCGQIVEPVLLNAVEDSRNTHPLARFLAEITSGRDTACVPFDWGAASSLPFLPRLRYRRCVLSSARWQVSAVGLPGPAASITVWTAAWRARQRRYRIPGSVYLGEHDVRIKLDLASQTHLDLLRSRLSTAGIAGLTEAPAAGDHGWIAGRAHEIIIPMSATWPGGCRTAARPAGPVRATCPIAHTPGTSSWVYAMLHTPSQLHSEILTTWLPRLLNGWAWGPPDQWWYLRYDEPEPHLRLRIPLLDPAQYGAAVHRIGTWADDLRTAGLARELSLGTYRPETGRYGSGPVLAAAETVFAADSAAAVAQLAATVGGELHPHAITAASFTAIAIAFTGGTAAAMRWLTEHISRHGCPPTPRNMRDQAIRLADPSGGRAALSAVGGTEPVIAAWDRRDEALATYRTQLTCAPGPQPTAVLASLMHLHHARVAGPDVDSERICLHLARSAALAWAARTAGRSPSPPQPTPTRQPWQPISPSLRPGQFPENDLNISAAVPPGSRFCM